MNEISNSSDFFLGNKLSAGHNKPLCEEVIGYIGNDKARFKELTIFLFGKNSVLAQRAAWPFGSIAEIHPELLKPYFKVLIPLMLESGHHPAIRRNIVRALQFAAIPEEFHGKVMDACFRFLETPGEAPAVKAFSMGVLENLWRHYPEIGGELKTILQSNINQETPAFKSRARKLLARL